MRRYYISIQFKLERKLLDLMPHLHLSLSTITFEMAISTTTTKVTL